jgi:hypothetical protein
VTLGTSGSEFGWRNGTGKWPEYYPDSLPTVVNTGLGSPTGVTFGYGAKFPGKYQDALYCVDWAYGKVYAAHLTPSGAGYRGTFETFLEGKAFDGTDTSSAATARCTSRSAAAARSPGCTASRTPATNRPRPSSGRTIRRGRR